MKTSAMRTGFLVAILAAVLFGATTPLVQRFGARTGDLTTASLLYFGAALVAIFTRRAPEREAPLARTHLPVLFGMALAGAVIAPTFLAWGLKRTSGTSAGLALNLEAVFTAILGRFFLHEHVGRRVAVALALMTLGGALLVAERANAGGTEAIGLLAVMAATFAWGVDNTLSTRLASLDPGTVVTAKSALGALTTFALARALSEPVPPLTDAAALAICGATGFGLSLRFYLMAQRRVGAARTASLFALAPFVAAAIAAALGNGHGGPFTIAALVPMLVALALHLTERHAHPHRHRVLTHEHAHRHDDLHHSHVHDPPFVGEHSHVHTHDALVHDHEHAPDVHHDH